MSAARTIPLVHAPPSLAIPAVVIAIAQFVGVLALGWDIGAVLTVYWLEAGVLATTGVVRAVRCGAMKWFAVPLALLPYALFMAAQLPFMAAIAHADWSKVNDTPEGATLGSDAFADGAGMGEAIRRTLVSLPPLGVVAVVAGHVVGALRRHRDPPVAPPWKPTESVAGVPWWRLLATQLLAIGGGILCSCSGGGRGLLLGLVFAKLLLELFATNREGRATAYNR